ncbi:MAG TPA: peptidyl-alpha-hydroxyglycine alpha-amidating lyase family protein, partial [Longimicrobiales bacterium]|nr:peptidyl-alpha-hydroxyglycine alpha-amidating lyase family protein [Longimicrobiales bacterium]
WAASAHAQTKALAENVPEIPLEVVPGFFKLPDGLYFGEGIGIATDSQGHIFVYTRSGDTRLFEFDGDGNFVREIGQGLYGLEMAHKVRIDDEDNIWVVDEGANLVVKFNPDGRVVMVLGHRPEASVGVIPSFSGEGPDEKYLFARPTDVTWDQDGNIFVSDGYFNHRVVKYSPDGIYMGQVGTGARGNGVDQFSTPHTIASDAQGNIYVGDRGNARVKIYDSNLNLLRMYENVGNPWEICISRGDHQYLFVSNSNPDSNPAASWAITGEIYKMELDGTIIGRFGRAGKAPGDFQTVHGLDCRDPNELYTAEISAWRAQKILLADRPVS